MRFVGEYMRNVNQRCIMGLEARSPFLAQDKAEGNSVHEPTLNRNGKNAHISEQLVYRFCDAPALAIPFSIGLPPWRDQFETSFCDSLLVQEGYIVSKAVFEMTKAASLGSAPKQLWYLYVLSHG